MREIKFRRAFFKDENKKDFSHYSEWGVNINQTSFTSPSTNNFCASFIDQQYTGLKDKNGKEIYEGDILEGNILVGWRDDLASFSLSKKGWAHDHYFGEAMDAGNTEVIGNIYENKDLL